MITLPKNYVYVLVGILVAWLFVYGFIEYIYKPKLKREIENEVISIDTGNKRFDELFAAYLKKQH